MMGTQTLKRLGQPCRGGRKTKERTNTIQYLNKSSYGRQSENKLNAEKNRKEVRNMVPAMREREQAGEWERKKQAHRGGA